MMRLPSSPAGTVDTLVKPENKATLTKILTYHVIAGKITSKELKKMIKKGGGTYSAKTLEGGSLTFTMDGSAASRSPTKKAARP